MTVLLLRLAGPLQSWGSGSRFTHRATDRQPTKSGVVGLLAAALGRRRTDPIEDLLGLEFGVRADHPGRVVRDFQTARRPDASLPLTHRDYLSDAVFVAAIRADLALIDTVDEALRRPVFPLYLGRRSCPPAPPLLLGRREGEIREVLAEEPWQAPALIRRRAGHQIELDLVRDAETGTAVLETISDAPISFDPVRRSYGLRPIVRERVTVPNPDGRAASGGRFDLDRDWLPTGGM